MGGSLAGQSCNPKNHERPFVIEWDATDMSMFQGRAEKTGVVFVKYEGCDLTVLDRCSKDNDLTYFGALRAAGVDERLGREARHRERG